MKAKNTVVDYCNIYESFPDMCLSLDPSSGKIIAYNQTLLNVLGYSAEELDEFTLFDLYAPTETEKVKANLASIKANKVPSNKEFVVRKKNGELLDVTLNLSFVKGDYGEVVYSNAVWRDISKLKETELLLKEEKEKVEHQNLIISQRNQNFVDAINYAKRIQDGMLPSKIELDAAFKDHCVYYAPKGIVSGDFYWLYEKNNKVLFAVADCTGHGVPGALMSMAGFALFDQIVAEQEIICAEIIFNKVRAGIIKALKQGQEGSTNSDGMDAALCAFNKDSKTLEFAGANNSLVIVRENTNPLMTANGVAVPVKIESETCALYEVKGQRQPLGYYAGMGELFRKQTFQLEDEDIIYLFSDGFQDQLGGEKNKKFLSKRFKQLLLRIAPLDFDAQKLVLDQEHCNWKGAGIEQTDDICILGVKF